ncbi:NACHT, LRR and PYD domains-containing protein 3-like isoform X6 [Lampetra planeri]
MTACGDAHLITMASNEGPTWKIIQKHRVYFEDHLYPFAADVLSHSDQGDIIRRREYTKLMIEKDPINQIRSLIDLVLDKGEESCTQFLREVLLPLGSKIPQLREWVACNEELLCRLGLTLGRDGDKVLYEAAFYDSGALVVMEANGPAYQIIKSNKVKLQTFLQVKYSDALDHSLQADIVDDQEYRSLKSETNPVERTRGLFDLVLVKGNKVCMKFLQAVLVVMRIVIPLLDQWISENEQHIKEMGIDLSRGGDTVIPGATSSPTPHISGADSHDFGALVVMEANGPAYQIIKSNKVKLQTYLQAKYSDALDHSLQADIVDDQEYRSLKSETNPVERTRGLFDLVLGKGNGVCMKFLQAVLVVMRIVIPLLDQWISENEQHIKEIGIDLNRGGNTAIPGAASSPTPHISGADSRTTKNPSTWKKFVKRKKKSEDDNYTESLLKLTSLTRDYNARPGEAAVFLLERLVKPILVLYYHDLMARGKKHEEMMERAEREGMTYKKLFDLIGPMGKKTHPRLVVVVGTPGSGKTMLSKFIVHSLLLGRRVFARRFKHIVLIAFRQLNNLGETSLAEMFSLLHSCLGERADEVFANQERALFVMDGLDEFGKRLDYATACTDPHETTTIEAIIASLVIGNLLPKASVLMTTRPITMEQLSEANVDRAVEITGFSQEDKIEFFNKFYKDKSLTEGALKLLQQSETVNILCHNPSFCQITAITLMEHLQKHPNSDISLKSTTDLFTQYLCGLIEHHGRSRSDAKEVVSALANMALKGVQQNVQMFSERDLEEFGVSSSELGSTFLNKVFTCEGIRKGSCYSFSHLTIQEFFAAIAMHLSHPTRSVSDIIKAIEDSKDGRFDVFQRFLCGLASNAPWKIFEGILDPPSGNSPKEIVEWLKHRVDTQNTNKHRLISLLHSLHELQDHKAVSDITRPMTEIDLSYTKLSLQDCAVLSWILQHREEPIEKLNLQSCGIGTEEMKRLQPALQKCKELCLQCCSLTDKSSSSFTDILKANTGLKKLVLSGNKIRDSGIQHLADGMAGRKVHLEELELDRCSLTFKSGSSLSVILKANTGMKWLELSDNKITDRGLQLLVDGMVGREWSLEQLDLVRCSLTEKSVFSLGLILVANTGLKNLALSDNKITDSGLKFLADGMVGREGSLETLDLQRCSLTDKSIPALRAIISTNKSLRSLWIKENGFSEKKMNEMKLKWTHRRDLNI